MLKIYINTRFAAVLIPTVRSPPPPADTDPHTAPLQTGHHTAPPLTSSRTNLVKHFKDSHSVFMKNSKKSVTLLFQ